jgi:hypothetical protein
MIRLLHRMATARRAIDPDLLRVGVAVWVLRLLIFTPSPLAADEPTPPQDLRVEDVLIEGKLYSPQAVFILSRPPQAFGSDSVLPHYLGEASMQLFLPYRLHDAVWRAAQAPRTTQDGEAAWDGAMPDSTAVGQHVDSRRSQ